VAVGRIEAGWEGGGKSGEKKGEGKGDYPMDFYSVSSGLRFWSRVEMMSREVVDGTSERAELTRFVRFSIRTTPSDPGLLVTVSRDPRGLPLLLLLLSYHLHFISIPFSAFFSILFLFRAKKGNERRVFPLVLSFQPRSRVSKQRINQNPKAHHNNR